MMTQAILKSCSVLSLVGLVSLTGCKSPTSSVKGNVSITLPSADTVDFKASISNLNAIEFSGSAALEPYGTVYVAPATPSSDFTFGATLNTSAFLKDSWVKFEEVNHLPTGLAFPSWVSTSLVKVNVADRLNLYVGAQGTKYVALDYGFVTSTDVKSGIGADYYDSQKRLVAGIFYYPAVVTNNEVTTPGGVFIASNLSAFWPSSKNVNLAEGFVSFKKSKMKKFNQDFTVKYYAVQNGKKRNVRNSDLKTLNIYNAQMKQASQGMQNFRY